MRAIVQMYRVVPITKERILYEVNSLNIQACSFLKYIR